MPRSLPGTYSFALLFMVVANQGFAEKNAEISPKLGKVGSPILHDSFEAPALSAAWKPAKGTWMVEQQTLVAKELAADKHAGVASIGGQNSDSVVRFSFQINGAKQFALSLNKSQGHLFRVIFNENGMTLMKDKDKADASSKPKVLAQAKAKFEPNTWYTAQVEILGDRVAAQTDSGLVVTAQDKELDVQKTGYRFVVGGESVVVDDLQVLAFAP